MKYYVYTTSLGLAFLSLIAGSFILAKRFYVYYFDGYTFDIMYLLATIATLLLLVVAFFLGGYISNQIQMFSDLPPPIPKQKYRKRFSVKYK